MDASARGRRLAATAKQLEADLHPLIIDQQEDCAAAAAASNTERLSWRADPKLSYGVVARGRVPYFIAEYIKQCRGPPGLSTLDKYDADGDGACMRRYTNPSFFRTNDSAKHRQQGTLRAQANIRGELKPRQKTSASVFSSLMTRLQRNIQKYESSPEEEKASSVDHSEVDISFTSSPDFYREIGDIALDSSFSTTTEQTKENRQGGNVQYQEDSAISDAGGSDYREQCVELGRTSSFEASLSPDFRTNEHVDTYHDSDTWGDVAECGTLTARQDSEMSSKSNTGGSKRTRCKGSSFEMIASRVTSLPRKLFVKQQDAGTDPVSVIILGDSDPGSELLHLRHENTRLQSKRGISCDAEMQQQQSSPLRKPTSVQSENSRSEDTDVVIPPLPPIPPMRWLSVKVHNGRTAHRKSLRKDSHKPWEWEGKTLKRSEFVDLLVRSDDPLSEPSCTDTQPGAETRLLGEPRRQNFGGDTDHHLQVVQDRLRQERLIEDHEKLDCKETGNLAAHSAEG